MNKIKAGHYKETFEALILETDKQFFVGDRAVYAPHSEVVEIQADIERSNSPYYDSGVIWEVVLKVGEKTLKSWHHLRAKKEASELLERIKEHGFIKKPCRDLEINL